MKKYIQHEYLKISHFGTGKWHHPVHNHNHFEIIYIHAGRGTHTVSGMVYAYREGDIFLLAPCDYHSFDIQEPTLFTFIKFTNVYLSGPGNVQVSAEWNRKIDELLILASRSSWPILHTAREREKAGGLMQLIVDEWKETKSELNEMTWFLIQALLSTVRRATLPACINGSPAEDAKITHILNYIHQYIHSASRITSQALASDFGFSRHYFGEFFKAQTGTTLRDYINRYKLHLIENRLKYSDFSIKEISNELGFTDLSHFNKFYKKLRGTSPSQFQRRAKTA